MADSQNVRFVSDVIPDAEFQHPPGAALARALVAELRRRGVDASDFDNWRDVGWVIVTQHAGHPIEIALASTGPSEWLLQLASAEGSKLIGLFRPSNHAKPILYNVAQAVSDALHALGCSQIRWRINGKPQDGDPVTPIPG